MRPEAAAAAAGPPQPDTIDAAEGRGAYLSPEVVVVDAPAPAPQPAADGIDWHDIGLGAGTSMALMGAGGTLLVVRRRGALFHRLTVFTRPPRGSPWRPARSRARRFDQGRAQLGGGNDPVDGPDVDGALDAVDGVELRGQLAQLLQRTSA